MNLFRRPSGVILTLSGDKAVWSRWRGDEQTGEYIESLPADRGDEFASEAPGSSSIPAPVSVPKSAPVSEPGKINGFSVTGCPWVSEMKPTELPLEVQLVVDSAHTEVLRIETASARTGLGRSGIGALIQERRLMQRLRQNHSDTIVSRARGTSALDAAWLSREQWPERWMTWIQGLQSDGVLFTRVSSSVQLLASRPSFAIKGANGDKGGAAIGDMNGVVVFVLIGSRRQQHTLVRDGVVVFRRVVAVDGEDSIRTALTDSLNHLQSRLSVSSVSLYSLGMPEALREEWRAHANVTDVLRSKFDTDESALGDECAEASVRDSQIARMLACMAAQAPKLKGPTPTAGPVAEVLRSRVVRDRMSRLSKVTAFSVLIASTTVGFAAVEGYRSVREDARLQQEQMRLTQRISDLDSAALSLHPQADTAAQLLQRIETLEQTRQRSVPELMNLLADALKDFPAIGLDTLQWRNEVADLGHSEPLAANAINESWAERAGSGRESGSYLVLEFSGKVDASRSLRERQEIFDAFVESLTKVEVIAGVEILLSPLAQAAASSRKVVSSEGPDYQLRVNLHDS